MLLTYLDEVYSDEHYYIAALCCPDEQAQSLAATLDDVVAAAASDFGVPVDAELHGSAIFHAHNGWAGMRSLVRGRIGVYDRAMRVIGDHDVSLILRGVDVPRLRARYNDAATPHAVVLQHVMERVNAYARSCHPRQRVLLIADEIDGQDAYRQNLWDYRRVALPAIGRASSNRSSTPSTSRRLTRVGSSKPWILWPTCITGV